MPTSSSNHNVRDFLPIPAQDFLLLPQRIDIWEYPLTDLWPEANSLLNKEESQRAKRYHFPRHQRRFTIARAMLRLILAQYLKMPPKELTFATNAFGKPHLAFATSLQFNLSHSRDLALLAIGHTHDVGIDLEYFSSRSLQGLSEMMFSSKEIQEFSRLPTYLRTLSFFHIWTQKEAFIKACGMGLSYPTQVFHVPVKPPTSNDRIYDPKHQRNWHMQSFMPAPACCAAVCHHPNIQTIRYKKLSRDQHVIE